MAKRRKVVHNTPTWLKQADAYLHDANRNTMPLKWSLLTELHKKGIRLKYTIGEPLKSKELASLKDPKLGGLVKLMNEWRVIEGRILEVSERERVTPQEEQQVSRMAKRMLQISEELKTGSKFLQRRLKGTEGADYYQSYLATANIAGANLKPLVERKERRFAFRTAVHLGSFFQEYAQRHFVDREGHIVRPQFKISGNPTIKVSQEILITSLNNLIQDAINHNPPTPIFVNVGGKKGVVSIRVFNEGPPIPKERLPLIGYEAYWSKGKGRLRGRGKISVRQFCEDHGGYLKVYNLQRHKKHFGPCLEMLLPAA